MGRVAARSRAHRAARLRRFEATPNGLDNRRVGRKAVGVFLRHALVANPDGKFTAGAFENLGVFVEL